MPLELEGAGGQFVDATNARGDMVLINELADGAAGRCGWTILRGESA